LHFTFLENKIFPYKSQSISQYIFNRFILRNNCGRVLKLKICIYCAVFTLPTTLRVCRHFFFQSARLDWENIIYIAVSLRERIQKSNVSLHRLLRGTTSVSPYLGYNFQAYIRNVIIGMYTSHMGSNRLCPRAYEYRRRELATEIDSPHSRPPRRIRTLA